MRPEKFPKADLLGYWGGDKLLIDAAMSVEAGRAVARDIGGSDPERMSAIRIADYVLEELSKLKGITVTVNRIDKASYPLMSAVNRSASGRQVLIFQMMVESLNVSLISMCSSLLSARRILLGTNGSRWYSLVYYRTDVYQLDGI